jgi:DHA2 family multidrug resistance protein
MFGVLVFLQTILIPLILKNLAGYPVNTIGLLLAPRAFGVLITAAVMGPMTKRVDPRILSCAGFATIAVSAYFMAQWSLDVGPWDVVWTGFLQGVGSNLVFVPLNTMAFSTLPARFRTEAVPIFYLCLNLGASVGIAAIMTYWSAGAQEAHAILVENISPFNEALRGGQAAGLWDRETGAGIAAINAEIHRQARMISYNNTFYLISAIALVGMVPILLLKRVRPVGPGRT